MEHKHQLATEKVQAPAFADQQQPTTEQTQQSATEHQQQLPTEQHQLQAVTDSQQTATEHKQQQLETEQHQLPDAADQQQKTIEHEKPSGSKTSLEQNSKRAFPNASGVSSLPMMPGVLNQDYFRFKYERNPLYVIKCRGIMNVLQLALSLVMVTILGVACQLRPTESDSYSGFFCQPAATFLFVTACGSFFTSVLYFVCCMISKKTEVMLFHTFFEVGYYLLYFILLLVGSLCLMDRSYKSNEIMEKYMYNYNTDLIDAVSIIGFVNSILYGISAFAFLATHYYYGVFLKIFLNREEQTCDTKSHVQ